MGSRWPVIYIIIKYLVLMEALIDGFWTLLVGCVFNTFGLNRVFTNAVVQEADPKATVGTSRILKLSPDQKEELQSMATPSCMEPAERKRQYSAMRRAIAKSCEPALLAKFQLCNDGERCGICILDIFSSFLFRSTESYLDPQ